ncbi:serine/threonine protein kinase [Chthoniobacter flavus Ellin428]|uniref:Serine/threonine protein kinase n=1 Tax=Chthoniobacter flavus Ellin428 TaxID=497964 RepID=B4D722_9BACT|nr:serine/threonine-protein kinase [Chthoniobacter flavus]EDY17673.1 serine/threonine protein kinase [Chthoniobacter flavus Ellin428]
MPTTPENPTPNNDAPEPSLLAGVTVDELFARGMQSVRMTGGGSMQSWEPPTLEEACRLFPNYQIVDVLGRGGMGVVYKAVQKALDRVVAIKLLPLEISIDRDFADRFVREARTMAKLNHPNIVSVYDFGTTPEGHLYFVMEFVEGTTLHHLIKSTGLKPTQALELIVNICEALQYAHVEGVVHRDIKPANVLVDTKGRVKVADFGLARVDAPTAEQWGQTMTGMVLGTPDYMAPEQKSGSRVDHRADIYSLGVMLYEMLCGQVPQGVFDPPSQRVSVDERIDQVVIRAMQQEPDRRYPNTGEMKTEVENIRLTPLPKAATPGKKAGAASPAKKADATANSSPETRRESNITPWLAGFAAVCALVAVSVVIIQMKRPNREAAGQAVPPPRARVGAREVGSASSSSSSRCPAREVRVDGPKSGVYSRTASGESRGRDADCRVAAEDGRATGPCVFASVRGARGRGDGARPDARRADRSSSRGHFECGTSAAPGDPGADGASAGRNANAGSR